MAESKADGPARDSLAGRAIAGDAEARRRLYHMCVRPMEMAIRAAFAGKRSEEDVLEVLQQAWIALEEALPTFREACAVQTYARRIAYKQAQQFLSRNGWERCVPVEPTAADSPIVTAEEPAPSPEQLVIQRELLNRLLQRLEARMRPEQKQVFALHFLEGIEHKEVGTRLGMDRDRIDQLVFQIKRLARSLQEELTREPPERE